MSQSPTPSSLEIQALSVLWSNGPSTVNTIIELFPDDKDRAYTTILSVLQNLEKKKKLVKSKRVGKANLYQATKSKNTVLKPILRNFVQNAFGNSIGEAASAILSSGALTPAEKSDLQKELTAHKTKAKKKVAAKKIAPKKAAKKVVKIKKKATKKAAVKKTAVKKTVKKKAAKKSATKKVITKKAAKKAPKKAIKKKTTRKKS